jgi:hypothetical protein
MSATHGTPARTVVVCSGSHASCGTVTCRTPSTPPWGGCGANAALREATGCQPCERSPWLTERSPEGEEAD